MEKENVILRKIFAPFLDLEYDPDPYKIFGIGILVAAVILAFIIVGKIDAISDAGKFAAACGLVATVGGYGSFLLGQGRKADDALAHRGAPRAPQKAQE